MFIICVQDIMDTMLNSKILDAYEWLDYEITKTSMTTDFAALMMRLSHLCCIVS